MFRTTRVDAFGLIAAVVAMACATSSATPASSASMAMAAQAPTGATTAEQVEALRLATKPTNDAPNPYETVTGWAKLPGTRTWGSTSAVDIDRDGVSIWVAERCGVNTCRDSLNVDPVMKFDRNGNLVTSFGKGMIIFPHGIFVDRDGNVWVTDGHPSIPGAGRGGRAGGAAAGAAGAGAAAPPAAPPTKGNQVFKFSPDGRVLLTLGKAGGGMEPEFFYQPNDILVAPNGEIYVAEGHGGANGRILKFNRDGTFKESWGSRGAGIDQYDQPHALAMDSRGRLFVGDRSNNRIKILDQNGKLLDVWYQFARPSGIYIDKNDMIYVADSESGSIDRTRPEWTRGIRVGSARDGKVTGFIPDPNATVMQGTQAAEGVAVDANGVVYGAEVGPRALKRYVRKQ